MTSPAPSPRPPVPVEGPDAAWLRAEADRLLDGARGARSSLGGYAWLDDEGRPDVTRPRHLYITARMTHCFSLGVLLGRDGDAEFVDHGLRALADPDPGGVLRAGGAFGDPRFAGWFSALEGDRPGPADDAKEAYAHAFVVLAGSSAAVAGRPGGLDLLAAGETVLAERFWEEPAGGMIDAWDRAWSAAVPYRGANANMHTIEALLAAADAGGRTVWLTRALRIAERIVHRGAREHAWRLPEHYSADWAQLPEYNADRPDDPFRPYGATPGHGLEWSRLLLTLAGALERVALPSPAWLREAAVGLYARAVADGWDDDRGGFAYTTGWDGVPVVRERFHWVVCEAICAAWTLYRATGERRYADDWARFWAHARATFLDGRPGWIHEADEQGRPSTRTWTGRPDIYHALQACLISGLAPAPSFARAAAERG